MKTLRGIDDQLDDTINEKGKEVKERLKFRFCFRNLVSNHVSRSGQEAMEFIELGLKLGVDGADLELEDEEFKKLKEAVDANALKWPDQIIGQLYKKIVQSEK